MNLQVFLAIARENKTDSRWSNFFDGEQKNKDDDLRLYFSARAIQEGNTPRLTAGYFYPHTFPEYPAALPRG